MKGLARAIALGLVVALAPIVTADTWLAPRPQIFASPTGTYGFKTQPPKPPEPSLHSRSQGMLFALAADGHETVSWTGELINVPVRAIVADDGKYVVTLDTWGRMGYEHCLVIYSEHGRVVADFNLEALLSRDEIANKVEHTFSSRHWLTGAKVEFNDRRNKVVVTLRWGKVISVALSTGKIDAAS
jgi:hypothetical protein